MVDDVDGTQVDGKLGADGAHGQLDRGVGHEAPDTRLRAFRQGNTQLCNGIRRIGGAVGGKRERALLARELEAD